MMLGDIRSEFGNLPNEFEMTYTIDGKDVEFTTISREGIVGNTISPPAPPPETPETPPV